MMGKSRQQGFRTVGHRAHTVKKQRAINTDSCSAPRSPVRGWHHPQWAGLSTLRQSRKSMDISQMVLESVKLTINHDNTH